MKKITLFSCTITCLLIMTACGNLMGVYSNPFEFRYPIIRCNGKVKLTDPDPQVVVGQQIDKTRGIWLLSPDVEVIPPKFTDREDDLAYIDGIDDFLERGIENKFMQDEWVAGVLPFTLAPETREELLMDLAGVILFPDSVDYNNWKAPEALVLSEISGYSLFIHLEGQIGINKTDSKNNTLFLYLIDNAKRSITYADFMAYECDVRNPDGLEKVLDHAYRKLLAVRFPETFNTAN